MRVWKGCPMEMKKISALGAGLVSALLLSACAASAGPGMQAGSDQRSTSALEGKVAPDGTPVTCRSMQVTGSRFPAKDCRSQAAWQQFDEAMAENARSQTDKFQRVNTGCATRAEGGC